MKVIHKKRRGGRCCKLPPNLFIASVVQAVHDNIVFSLLKKLYRDQKATVLTDEESDMFEIKKRTKQGDPLSSLLFDTVLQKALVG